MKSILSLSLAATSLALGAPCAHAITLVENGAPRATIVVGQAAVSPGDKDVTAKKVNVAAHDLQDYVKKMSGATLPIVGDDTAVQGNVILVGSSKLTAKDTIPSGLTPQRNEEGFVIQANGSRLLLAGNDAGPYHGTEYAAYELLNRLGVRWYMPGEFGEVVPKRATITFSDVAVSEKPDFRQRNWWANSTQEVLDVDNRWKIRNKMNPETVFAIPTDGSAPLYMAPASEAKDHPELFGKNYDGSVNVNMPNLSNPETVKIAADIIKKRFREHPEETSLGFAPADGLPRDFTPETIKRNQGFSEVGGRDGVASEMSATEEWIEWFNAVSREVKKEFPDHVLTTNGYANRNMAPIGVKADPDVSIMYAAIWSDTIHAFDDPKSWQAVRMGQIMQSWCKANDKTWLYNYDIVMLVTALTPAPGTHKLARDFPLMKKWGLMGFINQSRNAWIERGIATRYLNARLMWNANLDVPALLNDYYKQWYGAAAIPSRAFWEALEVAMEDTPVLPHEDRLMPWAYTPKLMAELEKQQVAAEQLASTPTEKVHVKVDRLILEHLQAYVAMNDADLRGDFAEAARQGAVMMQMRAKLNAIDSLLVLPYEKTPEGADDYNNGVYYWGVIDRIKYYKKQADKMSGVTGTLVSLLPQTAAFRLDPDDDGRFAGWGDANWKTDSFRTVSTAQPFYLQGSKEKPYMGKNGMPYLGNMWYQFKTDFPTGAPGRKVNLYVPIVECEAWLWVNGQYVGHRNYRESYERPNDWEIDVTNVLKPGQSNTVTLRVSTGFNRSACAGGLTSRLFLYAPNEMPATSDKPLPGSGMAGPTKAAN